MGTITTEVKRLSPLPILYSFRRCPYAMRVRMALRYAGIRYELREVVLRDKPSALLEISPKATVPVLQLADRVLEESLEIVSWALQQHDPDGWLQPDVAIRHELIRMCDEQFKPYLDGYKYAQDDVQRFVRHRHAGEQFLRNLEKNLEQCRAACAVGLQGADSSKEMFLAGDHLSVVDVCVFPFVRQFAHVDKSWFDAAPYPCLQKWLQCRLDSHLFQTVMTKYPQWREGDEILIV
jgi:glutathione S-transferase